MLWKRKNQRAVVATLTPRSLADVALQPAVVLSARGLGCEGADLQNRGPGGSACWWITIPIPLVDHHQPSPFGMAASCRCAIPKRTPWPSSPVVDGSMPATSVIQTCSGASAGVGPLQEAARRFVRGRRQVATIITTGLQKGNESRHVVGRV